jgi:hypothetical protein
VPKGNEYWHAIIPRRSQAIEEAAQRTNHAASNISKEKEKRREP